MEEFTQEKMLKEMLSEELTREEINWRDKAREMWINEGDKNTKNLHASVKERKKQNAINEIISESGSSIKDWKSIGQAVKEYFKRILNSKERSEARVRESMLEATLELITTEDNKMLMKPFKEDEVKVAVFSLHSDKALGPDGFPVRFFQNCWEFIKTDLCKVIEKVRMKGKFVKELNNIVIVIIPKKVGENKFEDYRPISLCNAVYKIIMKAIANRLKKILLKIISIEKNKFVPDREIANSIILASKTIHSIMSERKKAMIVKLDISKAYAKFADDTTLFGEATIREVVVIKEALDLFATAIGKLPVKYLRVLMFARASKTALWEELISKCRQKMKQWKYRWLSLPGRIQLIKSVPVTMPLYAMQVFKLCCKVLQALEINFKKFLWEGAKQVKKISLLNWNLICKSNLGGGAGLRHMEKKNLALGAKLIWKMYRSPEKLWCKIMQKKYLDIGDPSRKPTMASFNGGSVVWKFMRECRPIITYHLTWKVAMGERPDFGPTLGMTMRV
ncbi:uncharacterized protein LOC131874320 [Cryptomeria japonica]|uniref:uncharacterized protein LOC131874320 n=1 Tax=Cryptomeria japonica TaxID=3369 RepID=UPI0027DA7AD5|nr:uncharacterized protein LOC131874320 [Cryptomeria japonica]